jgi:hypothetical protein
METSAEVKVEETCGKECRFAQVKPPSIETFELMETFRLMFTCIQAAIKLFGFVGFTAMNGSVSGKRLDETFTLVTCANEN